MVEVEVMIDGHIVNLVVVECDYCKGAVGVDVSYLDQVSPTIKCPYCNQTNSVYNE